MAMFAEMMATIAMGEGRPSPYETVNAPACGSGVMLIAAYIRMASLGGNLSIGLFTVGQDIDYSIALMRMVMELKREMFELVIGEVMEVNDLEAEAVLSFLKEKGRNTITTCPGEVYKIVNMLMDSARMLEIAVEQCRTVAKKQAISA